MLLLIAVILIAGSQAAYVLKPINIKITLNEKMAETKSGCVMYANSPSDAAAVFIDFSGNIKAFSTTGSMKTTYSTASSTYLSSTSDDFNPISTLYSPYQNGVSATGYNSMGGGSFFVQSGKQLFSVNSNYQSTQCLFETGTSYVLTALQNPGYFLRYDTNAA